MKELSYIKFFQVLKSLFKNLMYNKNIDIKVGGLFKMSYKIETIRKKDHHTSKWSGGTTTQLLIYPKDSEYSERNFRWRLSSAKVEVEESVFTFLPGISRIIMIIDGELNLHHEGHHNALLKKFDQDNFNGEWETKSYGKVTDFNLMMSQCCGGKLETILLKSGDLQDILLHRLDSKNYSQITDAFYCVNGEVDISTNTDEKLNLSAGDVLVITRSINASPISFKLLNTSNSKAEIIRSIIYY